jgi:hypothetical protein
LVVVFVQLQMNRWVTSALTSKVWIPAAGLTGKLTVVVDCLAEK